MQTFRDSTLEISKGVLFLLSNLLFNISISSVLYLLSVFQVPEREPSKRKKGWTVPREVEIDGSEERSRGWSETEDIGDLEDRNETRLST